MKTIRLGGHPNSSNRVAHEKNIFRDRGFIVDDQFVNFSELQCKDDDRG